MSKNIKYNDKIRNLVKKAVERKIDEMIAAGDLEEYQKNGTTYLRLTDKAIKSSAIK